jgi:hypothetical protein
VGFVLQDVVADAMTVEAVPEAKADGSPIPEAQVQRMHVTIQTLGRIAIIDTMADSPMGQVAMVPMLAWIAREAPRSQKATYFAVMAAFTNLALSASNLATEYINKIFVIERGQYDELGMLMIMVTIVGLVLPILTVFLCKPLCNQTGARHEKSKANGLGTIS